MSSLDETAGMPVKLRLRCHYCPKFVTLDFEEAGDADRACEALKRQGWIFGVVPYHGVGLFDPICHDCGREVYRNMIASCGGLVNEGARKAIKEMYPELLETDA